MYRVGDKVIIKNLDELIKSKDLVKDNDYGILKNEEFRFCILDNFPFFGKTVDITNIDEDDQEVPYFVSEGLWLPEFMLKPFKKEEPKIKDEKVNNKNNIKLDPNFDPNKIYINQFNNRPFGELFIKLIKLDVKIAEFSNTALSKLKRHELEYIANLLMNNGAEKINIKDYNIGDLAKWSFNKIVDLDV